MPPAGYPAGGSQPGAGAPGPQAAWTPPPRPGLIPLRPLDLGTILGASFRVLRRNPKPTFGVALLVQGASSVLALVLLAVVSFAALSRLNSTTTADSGVITAGSIAAIVLTTLASVLFSLAATALLQGIIVLEVSRASLGEKLRLRQLWRKARGRLAVLIGWSLLVSGAVLVAISLLAMLIIVLVTTMGVVGIAIGVLLGIVGGLAALALGVWIGTKVSLVPSALMIERLTLRQAIARSWTLTHGAFWKTFGIQFLVAAMISIALQVISAPLSFLAPLLGFLLDPNGQGGTAVGLAIGVALLATIVTVAFGALGAVVQSATTALIYLDLRIRKEGLDLELARFVEARQSGATNVPDPYLVGQAAGARAPGHRARPPEPIPPTNQSPWT